MTGIYSEQILNECIFLTASDINTNIDEILLKKLKKENEGKCVKAGYIMHDSIKILSRSLGQINNANFNSVITFNVCYKATLCNPGIGAIVKCYITSIDKTQIVCNVETNENISPLAIYLFKNHHVGNIDFIKLAINDKINVKILASKFNYGDSQIIAIGKFE